jgi:glucose/arabinose dehydrogenase
MRSTTWFCCCSALILALSGASIVLGQSVVDPNLRVQTWVSGLDRPTGLAYLGDSGDALITERTTGRVKLMRNRAIHSTVLDLPVANGGSEQGLLGVALSPSFATDNYVYLYYTASTSDGGPAFDNRVDRYLWNGSSLSLDRHIVRMSADPGPNHNGGKITFGPDNKLYVISGDVNRNGLTQNYESSSELTRTGVVMRLQPYGKPVPNNPYYNPASPRSPINDVWAHGIRNGFGLDFDPVSGLLWDSENGSGNFDEINLVHRGFNSGWEDIMGPISRNGGNAGTMASLGPASQYYDPKLSWLNPVAPTDVHFLRNQQLGREYQADLFVGTLRGGAILHFDLSFNRRNLILGGPLADQVADNSLANPLGEQDDALFGSGFGTVTDIVTGPGGMYVLSLNGHLYRITRNPDAPLMATGGAARLAELVTAVPEPGTASLAVLITALAVMRRPHGGAPRQRRPAPFSRHAQAAR